MITMMNPLSYHLSYQDPTSGPAVEWSGQDLSSRRVRWTHTLSWHLARLLTPKWILENEQSTAHPKYVKGCLVRKNAVLNGMDLSNPVPRILALHLNHLAMADRLLFSPLLFSAPCFLRSVP